MEETHRVPAATSAVFTAWKRPKVESHGDYRDEAWLEEHIGGPLYQHQADLPRLPVPQVETTLERFLPTAMPLARTHEEEASLQAAVDSFPTQAAALQERLLQRRQDTLKNSSWLQQWWNQLGYLQVRDPVVINVSYFFHLADDPVAAAGNDAQIRRGAALLAATADYRKAVCSGQLPAETVGKKKTPLCSVAYKYMFHGTRIPARKQDSYAMYDPARYHHAIVVCQGHFFALDFVHPVTGDAYPLEVLQAGLEECRARAAQMDDLPQLGWLTSQNRDDWADARQALVEQLSCSPKIHDDLEVLQSGVLLLCLDDHAPVSRQECAQTFLHADQEAAAGANRWFDKSIQLVVTKNGKAGLLGEHSMMDGMPVVGFANRLTELKYPKSVPRPVVDPALASCNVRPIFADTMQELKLEELKKVNVLVAKGKFRVLSSIHRVGYANSKLNSWPLVLNLQPRIIYAIWCIDTKCTYRCFRGTAVTLSRKRDTLPMRLCKWLCNSLLIVCGVNKRVPTKLVRCVLISTVVPKRHVRYRRNLPNSSRKWASSPKWTNTMPRHERRNSACSKRPSTLMSSTFDWLQTPKE